MKRIFTIIVVFAVMSNTATGWKRRGHHNFHHHHDWNMEGNGHFPPNHREHEWHHHGPHTWDDSNKPHFTGWPHHQHHPCHNPNHRWDGNNGNRVWNNNNAGRSENNGNWVDNNPVQVTNNGGAGGIKDDGGNQIVDVQWPIIQRLTPSTLITQATPAADYPVSTEKYPIPRGQYPISTEQFPISTEQLPVTTERLPVSTEQLPVTTEQLPVSTEQLPVTTEQLPVSTEQLPVSTGRLPVSTEQFPNPTTISSSSIPQNVDDCERNCLVTSEYDPVCGTNYRTYNNMGRFLCAQGCGVDVKIFLRRACPPLDATTARAIVPTGLDGSAAMTYTAIQCILSCNFTEEDNPVCGSDGITYDNPSMILCAQKCGYNVRITSMSACVNVGDTLSNEVRTTPIPYAVKSCIDSCLSSTEYNPVCGTNGVTYQNSGQLDCAALCGVDVEILKRSPCSSNTNNNGNTNSNNFNNNNNFNSNNPVTTTTSAPVVVPSKAQLEACIRSCPQTPQYNPVCGTNGVTYNNAGHLSCAQACGIDVQIKRNSVCPRPVQTQSPVSDFVPVNPVTPQQLPITQLTTTTTEYMIASNGPVNGADIINIPPTQNPNVGNDNPPADDSTITISPALLLSIFSPPTTTPEPDPEHDIDPRYGEDKRE